MSWQEKRKREIDKLFDMIDERLEVSKAQLISSSRKKEFVVARIIFMNVLYEEFRDDGVTQGDIMSILKRNRCTFVHHRTKHLTSYGRQKKYKEEFDAFLKNYQARIS